jgi:hypothetical protein
MPTITKHYSIFELHNFLKNNDFISKPTKKKIANDHYLHFNESQQK